MNTNLKLADPFWTSGVVNRVEEFWGREAELDDLEANIKRSGIGINGPVGIGKSSLLSIMRLMIEGFGTDIGSTSALAMCGSEDKPWHLARKLFRHFRQVTVKKVQEKGIDLKGLFWKESTEENDLQEGDYITAVYEVLSQLSGKFRFIVLFFDEAHKCPLSLAGFIRELKEQLEHEGVSEVRFVTAGIGDYLGRMIKCDSGIGRAFQNRFLLTPWDEESTKTFVRTKLEDAVSDAKHNGLKYEIRGSHDEEELETTLYRMSGGHPFLTQLLGSYLIRHENADPDGYLDPHDLVGAMREICSKTRLPEYNEMIQTLESAGMMDAFRGITQSLFRHGPSQITRADLDLAIGEDSKAWFLENGFVFEREAGVFQLTDELLRVSVMLRDDEAVTEHEEHEILGDEEESSESGSDEDE